MSKKRANYSSAFKTKLVLELLQNESTLAEIASKHNILPQNLVNWKKTFLANAEIAMEPSKAVKQYKEELIKSQEQNERLTALVGKVTVEKEWLSKKLKSLGSSKLKQLIDLKPATVRSSSFLSINHQCQLLGINRSGLYYKPRANHAKQTIKSHITKVFEEIPAYGEKKAHQQLLEDGHKVSMNTVARYRQELGLQAVLAVKQVNTTIRTRSMATSFEDSISTMRTTSGAQTSPTSKLRAVWFIWQPSLIGIAKLCYRTRYQTPWTLRLSWLYLMKPWRNIHIQRYLIPIKAVNTPVKCIRKGLKN
jgi:transposase-like protein